MRSGSTYLYSTYDTLVWQFGNDQFSVRRARGIVAESTGKDLPGEFVRYEGSLKMSVTDTTYRLIVTPLQRFEAPKLNVFTGKDEPREITFTAGELAENLETMQLPWQIEVDSPFNSDASYANFARLARKEAFGEKDPVTGKIFKERFWISVNGRQIPMLVETYPYRSGSKIIAHAMVKGIRNGNAIDFAGAVEEVKREVERIVRS